MKNLNTSEAPDMRMILLAAADVVATIISDIEYEGEEIEI